MARHTTTVLPVTGDRWIGTCSCRWRSNHTVLTAQAAEDDILIHLRQVEVARASARRGAPSLKDQRDYYVKKAAEDDDPRQVTLWRQLADELNRRLNDEGAKDGTQIALW